MPRLKPRAAGATSAKNVLLAELEIAHHLQSSVRCFKLPLGAHQVRNADCASDAYTKRATTTAAIPQCPHA